MSREPRVRYTVGDRVVFWDTTGEGEPYRLFDVRGTVYGHERLASSVLLHVRQDGGRDRRINQNQVRLLHPLEWLAEIPPEAH